ncbi:MAG: flagellar biosynthetic protein FliO [Mesorhizobium sp.]|nr:flagellar biosynthetic protein FliO [Mesorhizobium sp.]
MIEWFESMAGPAYAPALMWTAIALLALFLILIAVKVFRRLSAGTFIAGGRNRRARLAVLDATAVDGQRRLVLVRRDDVEHLILIGGANDLVVEREIRAFAEEPHDTEHDHHEAVTRQERPVTEPRPAQEPRMAAPMQQPQAPAPRPAAPSRPAPPAPQPVAAPPVGAAPRPTPDPVPMQREPRFDQASDAPVRQAPRPSPEPEPAAPVPVSAPASPTVRTEPAVARPVSVDAPAKDNVRGGSRARQDADLDDALLQELELTLEVDDRRSSVAPSPGPTRREPHLDDEMDRLLGELSSDRR